jgi:hypothetical protein
MTPYCAIHVFPLTYSKQTTFTGKARVTRSDAISDLFLLPERAYSIITNPEKLYRSSIKLLVDSTPI